MKLQQITSTLKKKNYKELLDIVHLLEFWKKKIIRKSQCAACVQRINVRFTGPSYPQKEYITEGTYTARIIPFTANKRRKDIPGFWVSYFAITFLIQHLVPGYP